jgi:hypothetical protein
MTGSSRRLAWRVHAILARRGDHARSEADWTEAAGTGLGGQVVRDDRIGLSA